MLQGAILLLREDCGLPLPTRLRCLMAMLRICVALIALVMLSRGIGASVSSEAVPEDYHGVELFTPLAAGAPSEEQGDNSDGSGAALIEAIQHGDLQQVKLLTEASKDIVHSSWNGLLPLHQAARYGQVEIFRYLLDECGADPAQREGALANSVLHTAAWYKQPAIVEYILRRGLLPVDERTALGLTALHAASTSGSLEVVRLLLEAGAELNVRASDEETPLGAAARMGHLEIVRLLHSKGADPRISSSAGSPLIVAANAGHLETVKYLVFNAGCSTREQNSFGRTPLHQAVRQGHFEVAKWLVEVAGADILARGKDGLRPVHLAAMGGHKDLLDWIVSKGGLSCKELELKAYKQTCQRAISHEMELATAHLEQLCAKQQPSK